MKDFAHFLDKIYCINLDSRPDRWQEVSARFQELGIAEDVTRVSAIIAEDPRQGCRDSHVQCVLDAEKNNCENILILEDDVLFLQENKPDFRSIIQLLKNNSKWDLFYLGGSPMYPARFIGKSVFKSRFFSTHAYVVNKKAFPKIQSATLPIDFWFCFNTVSYGLYPIYAVQGESFSNIRQEKLVHIEESMKRRYDKLVGTNVFMRWWNYLYIHYVAKHI